MSQWEALKTELAFAVKINMTTKPVRNGTSEMSLNKSSKRSKSSSVEEE